MDGSVADGWQGVLEPGERILWQGQPVGGIEWRDLDFRRALFGLLVLVFAAFWTVAAVSAALGEGLVVLVFLAAGLFFAGLGIRLAVGEPLWDAFLRSRTWYTLTDRQAIIATDHLRRRALTAWPIAPDTVITLEDGDPGSVWFARGHRRHPVGFRRIAEPRVVYDHMRRIQRGQA